MSKRLQREVPLCDISPDWQGCAKQERQIIAGILKYEATPRAIIRFDRDQAALSDYWYWFILSTLWVSYSGFSDLGRWRRLFRSPRPNRDTSLMKPSEIRLFRVLPEVITAYRAHRPGEDDWISYTTDLSVATRFQHLRNNGPISSYIIKSADVLALFTRRGESEILMLDPTNAQKLGTLVLA